MLGILRPDDMSLGFDEQAFDASLAFHEVGEDGEGTGGDQEQDGSEDANAPEKSSEGEI